MSLVKYIVRRLLSLIPTLFGVLTLIFFLSRFMPGDPVAAQLANTMHYSPEVYEATRRQLGLDQPILVQYFYYLRDIFQGNWGYSVAVSRGMPTWELVMQKFPRTIEITFFSILISSYIGIKTGVISATNRNKPKDTVIRGFAIVGVAVPVFWLGMILQYLFTYQIDLLPALGYKTSGLDDPNWVTYSRLIDSILSNRWDLFLDTLLHLVLPVACLSLITIASITRQTRSSMLEVMEQDYIRTARAKGCDEKTVINKHALKNALIPTVTVIGLNVGALLSGAVLTETVFDLNGMGQTLMKAIVARDYYIINAIVFLITIVFVLVNLATDIIYGIVDPRIRFE